MTNYRDLINKAAGIEKEAAAAAFLKKLPSAVGTPLRKARVAARGAGLALPHGTKRIAGTAAVTGALNVGRTMHHNSNAAPEDRKSLTGAALKGAGVGAAGAAAYGMSKRKMSGKPLGKGSKDLSKVVAGANKGADAVKPKPGGARFIGPVPKPKPAGPSGPNVGDVRSGRASRTGTAQSAPLRTPGKYAFASIRDLVKMAAGLDKEAAKKHSMKKLHAKAFGGLALGAVAAAAGADPTPWDLMSESEREQYAKAGKSPKKMTKKAGLDPVGKEDKDINNDGKHDKQDKYLGKRRKAIGNAIKRAAKSKKVRYGVGGAIAGGLAMNPGLVADGVGHAISAGKYLAGRAASAVGSAADTAGSAAGKATSAAGSALSSKGVGTAAAVGAGAALGARKGADKEKEISNKKRMHEAFKRNR